MHAQIDGSKHGANLRRRVASIVLLWETWASGFELSALYGLADVSLVSMSEHLSMVRAIAGQCSLPIIADVDTGFGNAINVIHTVEQYERAGAAAVVIEDKQFPKVTSLRDGARQDLVRVEEFVGKIEAAIYSRQSAEFAVIARTREVFREIARAGSAATVGDSIANVEDVFVLQGMDRISADERRFLR